MHMAEDNIAILDSLFNCKAFNETMYLSADVNRSFKLPAHFLVITPISCSPSFLIEKFQAFQSPSISVNKKHAAYDSLKVGFTKLNFCWMVEMIWSCSS